MADKELRFSRDNFPASEGGPSTSEDPHQLIERLLLTEPAGDGDPRLTEHARRGERWVEAYLEYRGEETVWAPAAGTRAHRGEPWVEAYLAYYGDQTLWPRATERRTRRSEPWVHAYLVYDGRGTTDWPSKTEPHTRHGERWVQEYLAYYDQERVESSGPAVGVPLLKAASHGRASPARKYISAG